MLADADHLSKVHKMKISEDDLKELKVDYEVCGLTWPAKIVLILLDIDGHEDVQYQVG